MLLLQDKDKTVTTAPVHKLSRSLVQALQSLLGYVAGHAGQFLWDAFSCLVYTAGAAGSCSQSGCFPAYARSLQMEIAHCGKGSNVYLACCVVKPSLQPVYADTVAWTQCVLGVSDCWV